MKELKKAGFLGKELFAVNTHALVKRYNECLSHLEIEPTELTSFQIDGMGWSPQIAKTRENPNYLQHGAANQFAIILSPQQRGLHVFYPNHSFDEALMEQVFSTAYQQIVNITTLSGICFNIDQHVDFYQSPLDLEMLDNITVSASTPLGVIKAAKLQKKLTSEFRANDTKWMDCEARSLLIDNAKVFGDLRHKPYIIPDIPFSVAESFYTLAFGGTFVLRNVSKAKTTVFLLEDALKNAELIDQNKVVIDLHHPKLIDLLVKHNLINYYPSIYTDNKKRINLLKMDIVAQTLYEKGDSETNLIDVKDAEYKKIIFSIKDHLPKHYFELDQIKNAIQKGIPTPDLSPELMKYTLRANYNLSKSDQSLINMLLMKINPHSTETLYFYSKQQFCNTYSTWPAERKRWAIDYISKFDFSPQ